MVTDASVMGLSAVWSSPIHYSHSATRSIAQGEQNSVNDPTRRIKNQAFLSSCAQRTRRRCQTIQHQSMTCLKRKMKWKGDASSLVLQRFSDPYNNLNGSAFRILSGLDKDIRSNSEHNPQAYKLSLQPDAYVKDNIAKHLKALDSYFCKLQNEQSSCFMPKSHFGATTNRKEYLGNSFSRLGGKASVSIDKTTETGLNSLEGYFNKLDADLGNQQSRSESFNKDITQKKSSKKPDFLSEENLHDREIIPENVIRFFPVKNLEDDLGSQLFDGAYEEIQPELSGDETTDFNLISLLVSINIAVFLFEIASPVTNSNLEQLSIPMIYGAKVNQLIFEGEWWRLVTPMFLHAEFLHVVFSCWVLLTFGPHISKGYGSLTFFLVYILGGICANVTSFLHTPELSVCGTAPAFAIIGAWLAYQVQSRGVIDEEASEKLYWKAIIATTLSFVLNGGQLDEWTHLTAALSGICYGLFTRPALQLDNTPSENSKKEGGAFADRKADPLKSVLTFFVFVLALCPLIYMFDPDLDLSDLDRFIK